MRSNATHPYGNRTNGTQQVEVLLLSGIGQIDIVFLCVLFRMFSGKITTLVWMWATYGPRANGGPWTFSVQPREFLIEKKTFK